jgi:hypothetical protein
MKIGPWICMPFSNGGTVLRREAVFKKSPNPCGSHVAQGFTLGPS